MRVLILVVLGVLAGCVGQPSLEELEAEALATGDWTAVERREGILSWRNRNKNNCQEGSTRICTGPEITTRCECLNPRSIKGAALLD